ncbi:hypothetical protein TNIN_175981 [Trichonephila inaurata madagascariensis]|uniref:Uncharacterized protein n=1 Tax=Trichonephila inaurata madagascariensis TaxID=2747483 RepID=A0A8X6XF73_9ARAC|nr:hypothetical protein TNIN_175981 [Trichonephila inaurata madagascariensis]
MSRDFAAELLTFYISMSNGWVVELFSASGEHVQCQRSRFLTFFSCMSSVFEEELCSASGAWSVSGYQNSVLHQGMSSVREAELYHRFVRMQWRAGRTSCCVRCMYSGAWWQNLSCFRGMSRGRVAEQCPASGVCPVTEWQNSVRRQGYFQVPGSRSMSSIRGVYCSVRTCRELVHF